MPKYEEERKALSFTSVGELNKISEDVKVVINNGFQCKQYCKAANDIFRKANNFYKTRDEEQAYMLFMRYFYIVQNIKKSYEFVRSKSTYLTILKENSTDSAITKAEELSKSLHERYEIRNAELIKKQDIERKKAIEKEQEKKSAQNGPGDTSNKIKGSDNLILPEVPNGFVETSDGTDHNNGSSPHIPSNEFEKPASTFPSKGFISVTELYMLFKEYKDKLDAIMIIDIRLVEEYAASHINHSCIVNVPNNLLQYGANINSIERKLNKQTWEVWSSRFHKEKLIVLDYDFDNNANATSSSLFLLQDVLCKFEASYQVLILSGGFKQWLLHYPPMTTDPFYIKKPVMPTLLDSSTILKELTYPELPSTEKKRNEASILPPGSPFTNAPGDHQLLKDMPNDTDSMNTLVNGHMRNLNITDKQEFHISDVNNEKGRSISTSSANSLPSSNHPNTSKSTIPTFSNSDLTPTSVLDPRQLERKSHGTFSSGVTVPSSSNCIQIQKDNVSIVDDKSSVNVNSIDAKSQVNMMTPTTLVKPDVNNTASNSRSIVANTPMHTTNNNDVTVTSPIHSLTTSLNSSVGNISVSGSSSAPVSLVSSVASLPSTLPDIISSTGNPRNGLSVIPKPSPIVSFQNTNPSLIPKPGTSMVANVKPSIIPNVPPSVIQSVSPSVVANALPSVIPSVSPSIMSCISPSVQPNISSSVMTNRPTLTLPANLNPTIPPGNSISSVSGMSVSKTPILPAASNSLPSSIYVQPSVTPSPLHSIPKSNTNTVPFIPSHQANIPQNNPPKSLQHPPPQSNPPKSLQHPAPQSNPPKSLQHPPQSNPPKSLQHPPPQSNPSKPLQHPPPQSSPDKPKFTTTFGLPNGWEKAVSHETGRIYYKDHNTQTTHWQLPLEVMAQVHKNENAQTEGKASKSVSSSEEVKPTMKRSLSSPNLADLDETPNAGKENNVSSKPVIDRSVKPKEQKQVLVDRTKKPISASRLQKLSPVYGSLGQALTGLKNLGNTCYMNSVIQCLSNTTPLSKYFTSGFYEHDLNTQNMNSRPGEIARELSFVIIVLSAGQYRSVSPVDFKNALGRFSSQFNGRQQQDSHELLMFLLDGLHEDINKVKCRQLIKEKGNENLLDHVAADQAWDDYLLNNDSIIVKLFQGQFRSTVVCLSCGHKSKTFDAFNCLQLELPSNRSSTLQDCITSFTKAEKIGGNDSWKCSKCKCYREASKTIEVWKLPPVLIIQLKRFRCDGRWRNKIQSAINFPLRNFNMSNHIVASTCQFTNYHLYGVINHYGSFESGHYTAYCENAHTEKWYCFDDNIVKELDAGAIKTNAAYLLFYTAVDFKEYLK